MTESESPRDPMSQLAAGMVQMNEVMEAAVDAGFTRKEALKMVIAMMIAGQQK